MRLGRRKKMSSRAYDQEIAVEQVRHPPSTAHLFSCSTALLAFGQSGWSALGGRPVASGDRASRVRCLNTRAPYRISGKALVVPLRIGRETPPYVRHSRDDRHASTWNDLHCAEPDELAHLESSRHTVDPSPHCAVRRRRTGRLC